MSTIGRQMKQIPFGDVIYNVGRGIADAQVALDVNSLEVAQMMSGNDPRHRVLFAGTDRSLLELGFTPNFYQFAETNIEMKVTFDLSSTDTSTSKVETEKKLTERHKASGFWGSFTYSRPVGTKTVTQETMSKYAFSAEAVSTVSTRLVPIPPPPVLEELIRDVLFTAKDQAGRFVDPDKVPDVKGLTFSEAADFLRRAGYAVESFPTVDGKLHVGDTVPKAYAPYGAGQDAADDADPASITLVAGVPDVLGMTFDEGASLLRSHGFTVRDYAEAKAAADKDAIESTTPASGEGYDLGDAIELG